MSDKASSRDGGSSVTGLTVPMPPGRRQSRTTDGVPMNAAAAYRRGSISRRPSIAGMSHHSRPYGTQQTVKFENTYRIDPDKNCKFHAGVVERMLAGLLESFLDGELYEARKCAQISQNLTDVIKGRMKELALQVRQQRVDWSEQRSKHQFRQSVHLEYCDGQLRFCNLPQWVALRCRHRLRRLLRVD